MNQNKIINWTSSAQKAFEQHSQRIRLQLEETGVDAAEVIADIRRHIEEEATAHKLSAIAEEDVNRIIARFGKFEAKQEQPKNHKNLWRFVKDFWVISTIILAVVAIGYELFTGGCASLFFDPIPTVWHTLLVCLVPPANFFVWLAAKKCSSKHQIFLGKLSGASIAIAFFYTVLFLPILPLAAIGIIFLGLGLLPMAPLFSLISAIALRRQYRKNILSSGKMPGLKWGLVLGFVAIFTANAPTLVTQIGMHMVHADNPKTSQLGIKWLRVLGNKDLMLQMCYRRSSGLSDPITLALNREDSLSLDDARKTFYRVTGAPFNSFKPPIQGFLGRNRAWDDFVFDEDQSTQNIGGILKDLFLASSRMDASLDPDASLGYLEWTLIFKNDSFNQHEVRTQIALPSGSVVSRLTLWVNGEEREAAFAARGRVTEAYQKIVRQRRDPVLVTTSGPDRVIIQCFPVPPHGEMKIRVGMTMPLASQKADEVLVQLPCFVERNFQIKNADIHTIWIESKKPIHAQMEKLIQEQPKENLFAVRGSMSDKDLEASSYAVIAQRDPKISSAWAMDPISKTTIWQQQLVEKEAVAPARILLVIDGSIGMSSYIQELCKVIELLPEGVEIGVLVASDEIQEFFGNIQQGKRILYQEIAGRLQKVNFEGGCDNIPTLSRAWDLAARVPNSAILWIHAPQAVTFNNVEELRQRYDRRPDGPRLLSVEVSRGADQVLEKLDGFPSVQTLPLTHSLTQNLQALFESWSGKRKVASFIRQQSAADRFVKTDNTKETSSHLALLGAYDEVIKILSASPNKRKGEASDLAARYHLVTPVTGAVVLETQQQFMEAGLEPVPLGSVPTIPEPEIYLLIIVALLLIAWTIWKKRMICRRA